MVSIELIDRICQKFNVSYIDIIGKDKMLISVENYKLTLKIEVVKECGAAILFETYINQGSQDIDFDDKTNLWILMTDDLDELSNTKIYLIDSF